MFVPAAPASAELIIKGSRFLSEVFIIQNQAEVRTIIKEQKNKYSDATHVCHAFISGKNAEVMGMSDDGEPGGTAGRPMLDVLKGRPVTNILVTVTRWFGGTLLGTGGLYMGQQARKGFGLCYKTVIGNDVAGNDFGYKLHIVYGCKASPSEKAYATINDSPEAITFSWEVTTTPVNVAIGGEQYKPTSILTIDSTKFAAGQAKTNLQALEDVLYGTNGETEGATGTSPRLPLPAEVYDILSAT